MNLHSIDPMKRWLTGWGTILILTRVCLAASSDSVPAQDWIQAIRQVGPEGKGNVEAAQAWQSLAKLPASRIPDLLQAMDNANALAENWLHAAIDTIVERAQTEKTTLPLVALGHFLLDPGHNPRARSLAFDLIANIQPATANQMLPGFLNDPSVALRRKAVQDLLQNATQLAESEHNQASVLLYRQALGFARDVNQIQTISSALKKLNQPVDLPRHFGFLMDWRVIGPFHNTNRMGFAEVFPPETNLHFKARYEGKSGPVEWSRFVTRNDYGMVDLNKAYDYLKEVTAYAHTEFFSDTTRPAQLRLGCKNAWKIWFNGTFLFGRDEYHRGSQIDQYILPVQLKAGPNIIVVKLCQNEQMEEWTREWQFQLRVCDAAGTAILSTNRLSSPPSHPTDPTP